MHTENLSVKEGINFTAFGKSGEVRSLVGTSP